MMGERGIDKCKYLPAQLSPFIVGENVSLMI